MPPPATSWEQLSSLYDGFIFDQFGVMHNGATALDGAPALVARLAAAGKKLGILSNSSKRKEWTLRELPKLGFSAEHFVAAAVTTSGEEAWHALGAQWRGKACVWLSKKDGDGVNDFLDGTGVGLADVERADFLLASGTNVVRDGASVQAVECEQSGDLAPFAPLFARAIARGLPMVCSNPDFVSPPKPGKATTYQVRSPPPRTSPDLARPTLASSGLRLPTYQPGHLAAHYEKLGGRVVYYGKPHREHFEACVAGLVEAAVYTVGLAPAYTTALPASAARRLGPPPSRKPRAFRPKGCRAGAAQGARGAHRRQHPPRRSGRGGRGGASGLHRRWHRARGARHRAGRAAGAGGGEAAVRGARHAAAHAHGGAGAVGRAGVAVM